MCLAFLAFSPSLQSGAAPATDETALRRFEGFVAAAAFAISFFLGKAKQSNAKQSKAKRSFLSQTTLTKASRVTTYFATNMSFDFIICCRCLRLCRACMPFCYLPALPHYAQRRRRQDGLSSRSSTLAQAPTELSRCPGQRAPLQWTPVAKFASGGRLARSRSGRLAGRCCCCCWR